MKKALLLFLLLSISISGFSQDVKYGIRGGYNISNLDFEETPTVINKHRNSMYIGFLADVSFAKTITIVPEIQFSAEGGREESLQLDYIQAPILLKLRLTEKIYLGAGPQLGIKIHKDNDRVRNLAYSAVGGIEYRVTQALFVDARYIYGTSNVFDDTLNISAKNSNIQIGIGYKI